MKLRKLVKERQKARVNSMELKDTIELMTSTDYKDRFIAEYNQLTIRLGKLNAIISKIKENKIEFNISSSLKLLEVQAVYMDAYAGVLRDRAKIEGINLD